MNANNHNLNDSDLISDARNGDLTAGQLNDVILFQANAGNLSKADNAKIQARLTADNKLAERAGEISQVASVLDLAADDAPGADLLFRTLDRVEAIRKSRELSDKISLAELQNRPARPRATFSMKELITLAAILLLTAGILIPSFKFASQRTMQTKCMSNSGQIGSALLSFASDHNGFLPATKAGDKNWLTGTPGQVASNSSNLYRLLTDKYVPNPKVFQCPSVGSKSFVPRENTTDFEKPEYINYSFQYNVSGPALTVKNLTEKAAEMVVLADANPLFDRGKFRPSRLANPISDNHKQAGQSVLYLDGHSSWVSASEAGIDGDNIFLAGAKRIYTGREKPASQRDTFLLPAWTPEK